MKLKAGKIQMNCRLQLKQLIYKLKNINFYKYDFKKDMWVCNRNSVKNKE